MSVITKEVRLGQPMPEGLKKGQAMAMCQHFGKDQRTDKILRVEEVPGLPTEAPCEWAALCGACLKLYKVVQ